MKKKITKYEKVVKKNHKPIKVTDYQNLSQSQRYAKKWEDCKNTHKLVKKKAGKSHKLV